jgi:hypothetical protein
MGEKGFRCWQLEGRGERMLIGAGEGKLTQGRARGARVWHVAGATQWGLDLDRARVSRGGWRQSRGQRGSGAE